MIGRVTQNGNGAGRRAIVAAAVAVVAMLVPSGVGSSASNLPAVIGVGLVIAGIGVVGVGLARRYGKGSSA